MFLKVTCFHTVNNNLTNYKASLARQIHYVLLYVEKSIKEWRDMTRARPHARKVLYDTGARAKKGKRRDTPKGELRACVSRFISLSQKQIKSARLEAV